MSVRNEIVDYNPFKRGQVTKVIPVIAPQKEVWYSTMMGTYANCAYNESIGLEFTGELNENALKEAIKSVINRHESLRSCFSPDGEFMLVMESSEFIYEFFDCTNLDDEQYEAQKSKIITENALLPFDLVEGPLFRTHLFKKSKQEFLLNITAHHIICDGWSLGVIIQDISLYYNAIVLKHDPILKPIAFFSDYAKEQQTYSSSKEYEKVESFWLKEFSQDVPLIDLPVDKERPAIRTYLGERIDCILENEVTNSLKSFAKTKNTSLVNVLLSVFEIYLSKITLQPDIVVGLPTAGQNIAEMPDLVGHCVNLLPLKSTINGKESFSAYLQKRKEYLLNSIENQGFTFSNLLKRLKIDRDTSRIPLVPVVFNVDMGMDEGVKFSGLKHKLISNPRKCENFELFLNITGSENKMILEFSFNKALFDSKSILRMIDEFKTLIDNILENPDADIDELDVLPQWEKDLLLNEWCCNKRDFPDKSSIISIFQEQVDTHPDSIALVFGKEEISYSELNRESNKLANYLVKLGVLPGSQIAVCTHKSVNFIRSIIAVLKVGCSYIPIDPNLPDERLKFILTETNTRIVLTNRSIIPQIPPTVANLIINLDEPEKFAAEKESNLNTLIDPEDIAYIMYTSGSTGEPKGVCIPNRAVIRLVKNADYINFNSKEVFLQLSNVSFDASTFEIWGSLLNGAKLVLVTKNKMSLTDIANALVDYKVTVLWLTSGLFNLMVDEKLEYLKDLNYLLAGGDTLSVPHVSKALGVLGMNKLINGYGPTENTTFTTTFKINDPGDIKKSVPIGKPISNSSVYILNNQLKPVPVGVYGELYTGGAGLALSYLNRPQLSESKFINDPFNLGTNRKLYKTGDIARWTNSGNIEFLGRTDNQIKLRGFRVELAEIEYVISHFEKVKDCAVVVKETISGDKQLVAHIVWKEKKADNTSLREYLSSKLPEYMIPAFFIELKKLPLNIQGKVDRGALTTPDNLVPQVKDKVPPVSQLEICLSEIWSRELNLDKVGVTDNFFHIGGHSLIAVKILSEIEKKFNIRLPLSTFFENFTIRSMAKILSTGAQTVSWQSLVPIKAKGTKPPLFIVHGAGLNVMLFNTLANLIDADQPVYALQARGLNGQEKPFTKMEDIASYYVSEVLNFNPKGPYLLAGFSLGGIIAFEMAQQLTKMGKNVAFLGMFDSDAYCREPYFIPDNLTSFKMFKLKAYHAIKQILFLFTLFCRKPITTLSQKIKSILSRIENFRFEKGIQNENGTEILPEYHFSVEKASIYALRHYNISEYSGDLDLFKAKKQTFYMEDYQFFGWKKFVKGKIFVHEIPGEHSTIFGQPNDVIFSERLQSRLNEILSKS